MYSTTNSEGEITNIRVLFDIDEKGTEAETEVVENLKTVYGKVTKKFANSINLSVNDGASENYSIGDATVYSFENDRISIVTAADIQRFDSEDPARVFIRLYDNKVEEIIIVK